MSNPDPEIHPDVAKKYAAVVATGRSDFPNQINNVLAFPGVFRGALDAGARRITEGMKVAAAEAIFAVVGDDLAVDHIVPSPLDPRVGPAVAAAVAAASRGLSRPMASAGWRWRWSRLLLAGCGGQPRPPSSLSVGASSDPESALLANLYAAALRYYGTPAHVEVSARPVGRASTPERSASCPGSPGALLADVSSPGATARSDEQIYRPMVSALPEGVAAGDYTTAAGGQAGRGGHRGHRAAWGGRDVTALARNCEQADGRCRAGRAHPGRGRHAARCRRPRIRR